MALKEALQLNIYSKYEAITKKRLPNLNKTFDEINANIKTLNDPIKNLDNFYLDLKNIDKKIEEIKNKGLLFNNDFNNKKIELDLFINKLNNFEIVIGELLKNKNKISKNIEN